MRVKATIYDEAEGEDVTIEVPGRYEVCPTCEGRGTSCRLGAMTGDEFHEALHDDPDFDEDYRRGVYDEPCHECRGKRVVEVVDEDQVPPDLLKKIHDYLVQEAESRRHDRYVAWMESGGRHDG